MSKSTIERILASTSIEESNIQLFTTLDKGYTVAFVYRIPKLYFLTDNDVDSLIGRILAICSDIDTEIIDEAMR